MSKAHTPAPDYSRYFAAKQRAYLINMSGDREQYKSLSGTIVSCHGNSIAIQIPYAIGQESPEAGQQQTTYKITSESMGSGIQIMADLVKITSSNIFHFKFNGSLEMYQRRQMPRIDTTTKLFQIRRDTSLAVYLKEFKRIMDSMNTKGIRPNLELRETQINLGAGGIGIAIETLEPVSPLSMFLLDLNPNQPLVCAVAEMVWNRRENDRLLCGYRFIQIHKSDQERISLYVQSILKSRGIASPVSKTNWDLLDRMIHTEPEKKT